VTRSPRSWLFAPGHNEKLLRLVFDAGADVALLDLEDAVPPDIKDRAREMVAAVAAARPCWCGSTGLGASCAERDLDALAGSALGLRIPKVESAEEVAWWRSVRPELPLDCTIESARGVLAAFEIAICAGLRVALVWRPHLAVDLGIGRGQDETSSRVLTGGRRSRPANRLQANGVHPLLDDDDGLRKEAEAARRWIFRQVGPHPRQVPIINACLRPRPKSSTWANKVLAASRHPAAPTRTARESSWTCRWLSERGDY